MRSKPGGRILQKISEEEARNTDGKNATSPSTIVLSILSMRWSVPTLAAIANGHTRFNSLQRQVSGISHKVLIETLRVLQRDGFVHGPLTSKRVDGDDTVPYRLSAAGGGLLDLVRDIERWAQTVEPSLTHARTEFERRADQGDVRGAAPIAGPVLPVARVPDRRLRRVNGLA